jgi:hypothetical protein
MGQAKRKRDAAVATGFTTKKKLTTGRERVVEIKDTGNRFLVKRLNIDEVGQIFGNVPDLVGDEGQLKTHAEGDGGTFFKAMMRPDTDERKLLVGVIEAGLVRPSIGKGKDQIEFLDLDFMDAVILFQEILGLSGYGAKAKQRIRPT